MDPLIATAGLIAVGALTPGPNNLIVLRETAARGWRGALPAVTGILVGGLSLLVAVAAGANVAFDREPRLAVAMSSGACLLLAGLGLGAIIQSFAPDGRTEDTGSRALAASFAGLFVFQFLNPKAWVLVVAAVASLDVSASGASTSAIGLAQLGALFVLIPGAGLALWSWAGVLATRQLERRAVRNWLDRLTGALLIGFALLLFHHSLEVIG